MPNYNKVILAGHVGKDPEVKRFPNSNKATFSLAISTYGGTEEKTLWVNIETWNKTADFVESYIHKGDPVLIDGELAIDEWEKDGQKRSKTYVKAFRVESLGRRSKPETDNAPAEEDDLPF